MSDFKNGKKMRPSNNVKHYRTDASFQVWGAIDLDSNEYA